MPEEKTSDRKLEERLIQDGINIGYFFRISTETIKISDDSKLKRLKELREHRDRIPKRFTAARKYFQQEINREVEDYRHDYEKFQKFAEKYKHIGPVKSLIDTASRDYEHNIKFLQEIKIMPK